MIRILVVAFACAHACVLFAQTPSAPQQDAELGEIKVEGVREAEGARRIDPAQSSTTVSGEDLARKQPATVFEALRDVPGVSVQGGARPSGMKFNIRGYSDGEDVLIKLDGVTKSFEKYRFGGTFIEPELLKSITVERAPALASGSGALGGTVSATTKDAADLLRPGQRYGARFKAGYADNNDERLFSTSVYGRPHEQLDLLANFTRRFSNDITLPDGSAYENSKVDGSNTLLKGSWFGEAGWSLAGSAILFKDTGLQPYDATGGQPGLFGNVVRGVHDRTYASTLRYQPEGSALSGQITAGTGQTRLHDSHAVGQSSFANSANQGLNDFIDYRTRSLDAWGEWRASDAFRWRLGMQYQYNHRDVARYTVNPAAQDQYPDGFNPAQPPGTKRSIGAYIQPTLSVGPIALSPGLRWDRYEVAAEGGTLDLLAQHGESAIIGFEQVSPSFAASVFLVPKRFSLFYNYVDAFRPPLIDEYFTQGVFSRCPANAPLESFLLAYRALLNVYRSLPASPPAIRTNFFNRAVLPAYNAGVAAYNQALANNPLGTLAPASGICGALYKPEVANTQEVGAYLDLPLPGGKAHYLRSKLTYFEIRTKYLLESIRMVDGVVDQPGWEYRHGVEFESSLELETVFARLGYAQIRGTVNDSRTEQPLYDVPGDTLSLTLGGRIGRNFEGGLTYQRVDARRVVTGQTGSGNTLQLTIGMQEGYELYGLFARLALSRHTELRLNVDNLKNERYNLNDGFGGAIGSPAPGRNVRITFAAQL